MSNLTKLLVPPTSWQKPVIIVIGIIIGLGAYLFNVSNASSYLSDDSKTCVNCHVMNTQYVSWSHSSHRSATNCNDCHVPQDNFINKYLFKAKDGMGHAYAFTMRLEPQVIKIKDAGKEVVQQNCIRCHTFPNEEVGTNSINLTACEQGKGKMCWDCHREVPHGRVRSLSASPVIIYEQKDNVPQWIIDHTRKNTQLEK